MLHRKTNKSFISTLLVLWLGLTVSLSGQDHTDWTYNKAIYEVNIRQFTSEGTFNAFAEHLDRLEDLGAEILWFMPIHPIGQENRLGSLGSYYSIQNFLEINPEFGTKEDFKRLVDEIHSRGMYVMLDWVANHTSWDNNLTQSHPEWFVKNSSGSFISPPGTNWSDVIQLDHAQPGLQSYMKEAMRYWVQEFDVDGFRFDAVDFVPESFWRPLLDSVKITKPNIFYLAESDGTQWHGMGFDSSFGWGLYGFGGGVLSQIMRGEVFAGSLATYANTERLTYRNGQYRLYFTSNHDENSWEGTVYERFGNRADAFAVLASTFNGMPLIYNGQEAGLDKRLAFFDKDEIPWRDHPNFELYKGLLALKKRNKALWNGDSDNLHQRIQTSANAHIFAFLREKEDDRVFVAINVSNAARTFSLTGESFVGSYSSVFNTDEAITLTANQTLTLPAGGYIVLEGSNSTNTSISDFEGNTPNSTSLDQNYPNPFNPSTTIKYTLSESALVKLTVFDVMGKAVSTLVEPQKQQAGNYAVVFDALNLASGIYRYRLQVGNQVFEKKMTLLK
jgi:glycosidase